MNEKTEKFRQRRNACEIARVRINDLANGDRKEPFKK